MESMGSIPDNEWESICKLLSAPQLNINSAHLLEYSSHITQTNYSQSSENANLGTQSFEENTPLWNNDASLSMDFILDPQNDGSLAFMFVQDDASKEETTFSDPPLPVPKKKVRLSNPTNKARKLKKMIREETSQSLECDPSEDALSNDSEEISEIMEESESNKSVTLSSNGKKRANRGEATDPQSLYARRRRMRINERLKILQSLVPNGTKVDISTMLEEAIHYVKFMQLQIRLLSSDDHWMYAPLAYNGVDVGAYKRLSHYISYD